MQSEGGASRLFRARHNSQAGLRLLRGEVIDLVAGSWVCSRDAVPAAQHFPGGRESGLKPHPVNKSVEVGRLCEKIGEQAMGREKQKTEVARAA